MTNFLVLLIVPCVICTGCKFGWSSLLIVVFYTSMTNFPVLLIVPCLIYTGCSLGGRLYFFFFLMASATFITQRQEPGARLLRPAFFADLSLLVISVLFVVGCVWPRICSYHSLWPEIQGPLSWIY